MEDFKRIIFRLCFFIFLISLPAGFIFAQRDLEVEYPEISGIKPTVTTISLPDYVKYIFNFSISIAGLITLTALTYAGFKYLTSVGSPTAQKDAKDRILAAISGLLILLSSYLILTTINPQLIIINLPTLDRFDFVPFVTPPPEEKILQAQEIPLGGLIEAALNTETLNSIESISGRINEISQDMKDLAEELKTLTDSCSCDNTTPNADSCEYGATCPATSCGIDPCPNRARIEDIRRELLTKANELRPLLENRRETNGSSGLKELAENLGRELESLESAEDLMKNCEGQGRILFGSNDFEQYRQALKETKVIKDIEIERPWEGVGVTGGSAAFYCVEQPTGTINTRVPPGFEEGTSQIQSQIPEENLEEKKSFCGSEIKIGETVDMAESLIKEIVDEVQLIVDNSEAESAAGENLAALQCGGSEVCSTGCNQYTEDCGEWGTVSCSEGDPEVSCQTNAETGVITCVCPNYEPETCYYCDVLPCSGPPPCPNAEIAREVSLIGNASAQIDSAYQSLRRLITERDGGKTQPEKIINQLADSGSELGNCYNTISEWRRAQSGGEATIEGLISCGFIKKLAESQFYFYSERNGAKIRECYWIELGRGDRLDNYFCCKAETGP